MAWPDWEFGGDTLTALTKVFSNVGGAAQTVLGSMGKTLTGASSLADVKFASIPSPNYDQNIIGSGPNFDQSPNLDQPFLKLHPALGSGPNIQYLAPNFDQDIGAAIKDFNPDAFPQIDYGEKAKTWATNQLGLDANLGRNYLQELQQWGSERTGLDANNPNYVKKIQEWGGNQLGLDASTADKWAKELGMTASSPNYGQKMTTWWHNTMGWNKGDDGSTGSTGSTDTTDTTGDTTSTATTTTVGGPGPDDPQDPEAITLKGAPMSEADKLERLRRLLAGRYGRAETNLTGGGSYGQGEARSLGGY